MTSLEASVIPFLQQFADSWQKNDGTVLADTFTDAGTIINPFGQRADGRSGVAAMYDAYFNGMLAGTTTTIQLDTVRPVGNDHAFVDAEQTIHAPDGDALLVVHLAALLQRDGDAWRFVDSRPYTTPAAP